jgi:exosortase
MNLLIPNRIAITNQLKAHKYFYAALAALVLTNITSLARLVEDWGTDANYSHGFLIIPISIWLFWRERNELVFPGKASIWGMLLFLCGAGGLVIGLAASELFSTRMGMIMMVTGMSLYYLGWPNFRKVWFAFFFLLFMVPIPATIYYAVTLPLQLMATKVTVSLLHIVGVPCSRSGNIVQLPNYRLEVLEACSGLRSLVTLMALGALHAHINLPGKVRPVLLFLGTIPIAIATNIVRIFFTAIAAYAISTEFAEDFLHELSGFFVFFTAMVLTLVLGALLKWRSDRS